MLGGMGVVGLGVQAVGGVVFGGGGSVLGSRERELGCLGCSGGSGVWRFGG